MQKEENKQAEQAAKYEGVFPAKKKNGEIYFRASLTHKRKHISLGSFTTPNDAHKAYLEGLHLIKDTSLAISHYKKSSPLAFEKWVCLINFRDNGLYFGHPIYIAKRMFYYHISPSITLKFDPDDLFYYSSHKIMRRGNHYFVADYGSQVSITTRYGIKPYAVEGRDFRFINGDNTDFRRENLEIFNIYHGIIVEQKKGHFTYAVRIHVRGNFLVGRYKTEEEAAIAYNKAIDILKSNGVTKNFTPNYIENISPRRYAEIYTALTISSAIYEYKPRN